MYNNSPIKIADQFHFEFKQEFNEIEGLTERPKDIINLSIGDPDLPTDPKIIKEGYEDTVKNGYTHYSPSAGYDDLREEIVKCYKEDFNMDILKDNVFITSSATMGMYIALKITCNEGDEILVFSPYYINYKSQIESFKAKMVTINLSEENDRQVTYEMIKNKITNKTKGIIINTPNNPTGSAFNEESIQNIVKVSKDYNLIIYADDIYTNYVYNGEFIPISKYAFERTISIRSFSKDFCMTGFRIGYMIIPKSIFELVNYMNENISYTVPTICQRIALYALKDRKRIYAIYKDEFQKRINYAYNRVKNIPFLKCNEPKGAIYMFINIQKTGLTSAEFKKLCYDKCHIIIMNGASFGENGEGYIRIAITCNIEKLKEAFDRIEKLSFK